MEVDCGEHIYLALVNRVFLPNPRISPVHEQTELIELGVPGNEENRAFEAVYLWQECRQVGMVDKLDKLPVFEFQYLLVVVFQDDVGDDDLAVVRQE